MRLRHAAAGVAFATLACVISWPLPLHLSTHLPGGGIGDNVQFLWNFWWMRTALASGVDFFQTPYLFAPFGSDITLHTHTALPAFLGATLLGGLPLLSAHNLMLLGSLALNGVCAYALAWRITRDFPAALLAGVIFAASPYLAAHLHGHFNLTAAWTIPLFVLAAFSPSGSRPDLTLPRGVATGLVLGLTAYVDYYYVVYQLALAMVACVWATHTWTWGARGPTKTTRRLAVGFAVLAVIDLVLLIAIGLTGGFRAELGSIRISARSAFNPLQGLWIVLGLAAFCYWRPYVRASGTPARRDAAIWCAVVTCVSGLVALPVLWHGASLVLRGEYVTQQYFWRSAPRGVDLGTLVLGHPFHGVWGGAVRHVYGVLGIDTIESVAWLGVTPLVLAGLAVRGAWRQEAVRAWTALGAFYFIWALGPHLMLFGMNSGLILPQTLLRYLPIVANARVPGRAMVVTYLALSVLAAIAVARWRVRSPRAGIGVGVVGALVLGELLSAPFPVAKVELPAIYATVRDQPGEGILLELPAGTRDSFQSQGALDHRLLAFQTIHHRPIVGGVVSRLSLGVINAYEQDPLLGPLLRVSPRDSDAAAAGLPDAETAARLLEVHGIRYVMLNRDTASGALITYVEEVLPLRLVATEEARSLFVVDARRRD